MTESFDLVIIGSGTTAQVVSSRVRDAGWSVAVIDHRPFGGTCALRGCDPKKVLISGAEALDASWRMRNHGVSGNLQIQWRDLMAFKRTFTGPVPVRQEQHYEKKGIVTFHGMARFIGPDTVSVNGQELKARFILIATGAAPVSLGIPGKEHVVTSEQFLELDRLPGNIVLVGGGYIAAEFSHIAARAGTKVTILQRGDRMLTRFDPDLVSWLMEKFGELGIDVHTRSAVQRIDKIPNGFLVHASGNGHERTVRADLVVHAAGRAPDLEELSLPAGGISFHDGQLQLNQFLQSVSNARVYAAGDAAGSGPPLTPVSSHDGKVVASNLLEGNHSRPDYRGVPSVAFTIPPIASVGLAEAEARQKGLKFRLNSQKASDWYTARRLAEQVYGFKVLVEEDSERILGAHLVGPHADEIINLFAFTIRHNLTASDLKTTIFAYPTAASDISYMV
jgi:glutathione reductase (NADPH)